MALVSIVIITYNSAAYVLETLESAKNQTYPTIELIISDDGSTDNTIEICKDWLLKNENRFVNTKLVTVEQNTGVAANCNRGIQNASTDWIKFSAGDDLLLPNCIQDNMNFVTKNENVKVLFSQLYKFIGNFDTEVDNAKYPKEIPLNLMDPGFSAQDQYKRLLLSDRITYTPSFFFNKQTILSVGGFDEKIAFIEDYPMWLNLTKAGIKLYFMGIVTVAYRLHNTSLNTNFDNKLFSTQYLRTETMRNVYVYPNLPWDLVGKNKLKYCISKLFNTIGLNKNTNFLRKSYQLFTIYLNPFQYIISFKKHILGFGKSNIFYAG